jgi:pimeloyl-ACP methyl ester carboxylesterase
LRLHYLDWGKNGHEPLLFLHGGALTAHTWDLCCLALREEFHCLSLDQRGHGDSDWAPDCDYSIAAQARDIGGFLDALGLARVNLVGMSLGAINALGFAIEESARLASLVLIDAGPKLSGTGVRRIRDFVNSSGDEPSLDAIVARALAFNPRRDALTLRRSLMHNLKRRPDGAWAWKYDRRRFQALDNEAHHSERTGLALGLARITCPTLVVRGGDSDVFTEGDAAELASGLSAGSHITIPHAGHTVQGDNPKDLVAVLRQFLERH